jgi:hypothetical protein
MCSGVVSIEISPYMAITGDSDLSFRIRLWSQIIYTVFIKQYFHYVFTSLFLLDKVSSPFTTRYAIQTQSNYMFIENTGDEKNNCEIYDKAKEIFMHLPSINAVTNYMIYTLLFNKSQIR